ncbi:MAG: hypothetical protein FWC65_04550, partial [Treponema sp.]|nr:hypothetical protein [Treponema sp.]
MAVFIAVPFFAESREEENFARVLQSLRALGISYEERPLAADFSSPGSSILARREASALGTFVAAIPLEADFAVDVGLALAEKLQDRSSPAHVIVAFLGNGANGLRDILALTDIPENWVLCYVDIAQMPEAVRIRHGTRGYVAPLDVLKPLTSLLEAHRIPWSFRVRFNELYRLGVVEGHEALAIAWEQEVNSFALAGAEHVSGYPILPQELAALLLDYAQALDFPMLMVDRHYFFFNAPGGGIVFIGEGLIVALLLVMAGICFFLF